jgi:TolB-like protein/tetratricopeptide (TPR) repeat protein/predicted Ser/Thr protein kinase
LPSLAEWAHAVAKLGRARIADPMTAEKNDRGPPSTQVSPFDLQLSACAIEGAQADISSNTVRLAVGQLIGGRYRIERELGEGGMGVVYLAADEQVPGERFAIKVLKEELHPGNLALLREEVRKTRKLSHPNIVDVHSVNVDGQHLYVLMEYLEGKSLDKLLDEEFGRGMPFSHAWPIIEDVGAALGNAHDHNVIHSDLKPANVFLTTSGRTKLLDFGIARVSRGPLLHARSGPRALTPAYASCEMLEGKEADRRDDIYSFACVIYEMLCGDRAFGELTVLEAREAGVRAAPLHGLSREQNAALARALAFGRDARTGSVETLLAGLAVHTRHPSRSFALLGPASLAVIAAVGLTWFALDRLRVSRHAVVVDGATSNAQQLAVSPNSIAVLPLLDLSTGHEQQYFADGLTAALIDRLTLLPGLSVTGQTSSFAVKGSKEDAPTLARRLRVEYLLEGTVRGSAEQLRVSTRLIRAADGFELWSQVFDRSASEILKLEEDIVRAVAVDLHETFIDMPAGAAPSTRSPEAYRLLLQAFHLGRQESATDAERALIEAALQKDSRYVDAWVALGDWWYESMLAGKVVAETAVGRARTAYDRAFALDKNSSGAHIALAWLQMSQLDWVGAQRSIERAATLDPANLSLLTARGELARSAGRWAEAIRLEHERLQRDPLSVGAKFVLAQSHLCGGEYANAEEIVGQAIAENPRYAGAHALLARALAARGEAAAAIKVITLETDESARLAGLANLQFALGSRDAADEAITKLRTRYGQTLPGLVGLAYAYRNELEPAFQWLQRAVEQRQPEFAASLACTPEPAFNDLHADPRFSALRSRVGFNR